MRHRCTVNHLAGVAMPYGPVRRYLQARRDFQAVALSLEADTRRTQATNAA